MVKVTKTTMWKCCECEELHESEYDAQECCKLEPDVEEVPAFKCGDCEEFYEDKEEARSCCKR